MGAKKRKTDIYTEMSLTNWGDGPPVSETMWLDGWGYDRLQAQNAARVADVLACGGPLWSGGNPTFVNTETEEALREEIASQAEVIEAQDMQIEALQEERDALLAELDAKDKAA
jgi:hypothetical protein